MKLKIFYDPDEPFCYKLGWYGQLKVLLIFLVSCIFTYQDGSCSKENKINEIASNYMSKFGKVWSNYFFYSSRIFHNLIKVYRVSLVLRLMSNRDSLNFVIS